MRAANILFRDAVAGRLVEDEEGYTFTYAPAYLASEAAEPVSLTLPLAAQPYQSKVLFPFFDGLVPEGWLLTIATKNWKIDPSDRMGLLLTCCKDCIGAVSVVAPMEDKEVADV